MMNKTIAEFLKDLRASCLTRGKPWLNYGRRFWDVTKQCILLLVVTAVVNIGLLYLCKMLWYTYASTPMGQQFITLSPGQSNVIFDILNRAFFSFSVKVTIATFATCMLISGICRVLHITRYLYDPRGLFGKLTLWGLPLTAAVGMNIQDTYRFYHWGVAYALALVPTLCVFTGCFRFADELLPEMGDLIGKAGSIRYETIESKLPNLTRQVKKLLEKMSKEY